MKLFLDTSVLLAAAGSNAGASREIFRLALHNDWTLISTPYVTEEVIHNLPKLPDAAKSEWDALLPQLTQFANIWTIDKPTIFQAAKDRPILFSAYAWADVLLTLDAADFGSLIGSAFYGMPILKPGQFLEQRRLAGLLNEANRTEDT